MVVPTQLHLIIVIFEHSDRLVPKIRRPMVSIALVNSEFLGRLFPPRSALPLEG